MSEYKLRESILELLLRIEKDEGFSHLLIDHEMKKNEFHQKDKKLLTEIVYGTMQRKITLDFYLDDFIQTKKKIAPWVQMLLRMSVYQMIYLDKIPDHAVIHEAVEIAKRKGHKGIASFVNGVLRNIQRKGVKEFSTIKDEIERVSVETSHPKWLVERWVKAYGFETTSAMCHANVERKKASIRIQPLKISREKAIEQLREEGFEVKPSRFSPQGIIIEKGNIIDSRLFREGYVTIQDQSSMLVAEVLDPEPDMYVLDACSAPGGKATHIAEKMQNKGRVDAYDLHAKKVNLIKQKAAELQLTIIHPEAMDARRLEEVYEPNQFDRILVDAPCSGLGVMRGKPEIKYHKSASDIKRLAEIQLEILNRVSGLLKKDGRLVYSTCTVDVEENEQVVQRFLKTHNNFEVDRDFFTDLPEFLRDNQGLTRYGLQLFPQDYDTDGFFLTRLKKVQ